MMTTVQSASPETRTTAAFHGSSRPRRWAWLTAVLAGGLLLFAAYERQAWTSGVNSDGASNALQAWDMLHGNLLLHGWTLTDVSFYTIELPQLAVAERIFGLSPLVLHLTAALDYTLVVLLAALAAKGRATGLEGVVRSLLAAGIMLAPPLGATTTVLMHDPDHTATQIVLLLVWLVLDRCRPGWPTVAVVAVLLTWGQLSDPMTLYEGALPLAIVCAIRICRSRGRRTRFELSLIGAALASIAAAAAAGWLLRQAGGYLVLAPDTAFAPIRSMVQNIPLTAHDVLVLFGADFSGVHSWPQAIIPLVHLAGVALAGWAIARALRHLSGSEFAVQLAAVAVIVLLAAYAARNELNAGPHELTGVLAAASVLSGRLLARPLIRRRRWLAVGGLVLACYAAILVHDAVQPSPSYDANRQLASWLRAHHLSYGLGSYWNADIVRFDSQDHVQVTPVYRYPVARLRGIDRASQAAWFSPREHNASFLVVPTASLGCLGGTPAQWAASARRQFGAPAASYRAGPYLVLTWHENLLSHLGEAPPGNPC
jgi:hypothetical protein